MMSTGARTLRWRPPREALFALASGVLVVAAVMVFAFTRGDRSDGSAPEPREVHKIVGEVAPPFTVDLLHGGKFTLADYAGKPVWINVWATWCPPCRVEMPDIDEFLKQNPDLGLVFLAMDFEEAPSEVETYVANTKYSFMIGLDTEGEFSQQYGVGGLPTHIFIGADGRVESVRVGSMTKDEMRTKARQMAAAAKGAAPPGQPR